MRLIASMSLLHLELESTSILCYLWENILRTIQTLDCVAVLSLRSVGLHQISLNNLYFTINYANPCKLKTFQQGV